METEKKKEPRDESPDQSVSLKESGSSAALLNLVNHSQNPNEIDKKTLALNLMMLLQLPPEKLLQLTSSMEKNILNGLILKFKLLVNSRLSFDLFFMFYSFIKQIRTRIANSSNFSFSS